MFVPLQPRLLSGGERDEAEYHEIVLFLISFWYTDWLVADGLVLIGHPPHCKVAILSKLSPIAVDEIGFPTLHPRPNGLCNWVVCSEAAVQMEKGVTVLWIQLKADGGTAVAQDGEGCSQEVRNGSGQWLVLYTGEEWHS